MSKTADPFLEMLATPAKQKAARVLTTAEYLAATRDIRKPQQSAEVQKYWAESASQSVIDDYQSGNVQIVKAPAPRPSYADDIDRIVAELVADGRVVFDQATDSYRRPHVRRWRFAQ